MKIFYNLFIATLKDMLRDKMNIFWFLMFPVIFILLFGFIFSGDADNINVNIGVMVEQDGLVTEEFISSLGKVPAIDLHQGTLDDELEALRRGERSVVIVLPEEI